MNILSALYETYWNFISTVTSSLRIFMRIDIFMNSIKEMKLKQKFVLVITLFLIFYIFPYFTSILCVFGSLSFS